MTVSDHFIMGANKKSRIYRTVIYPMEIYAAIFMSICHALMSIRHRIIEKNKT